MALSYGYLKLIYIGSRGGPDDIGGWGQKNIVFNEHNYYNIYYVDFPIKPLAKDLMIL